MGKIYGSNRVLGTVGGVRHYRLPGCDFIVAAEKGGANGNLIKNNPAFKRTRENNEEWKGVTITAQAIKRSFGLDAKVVVNRFLIGALNKAMLKVVRYDPQGIKGTRSIFLSDHKEVLDTIQYYYYKPFGDIMKCRYEVDTGFDRKSVTVKLTNLNPSEQIKPPDGASHFRFFLSIGVMSDYYHIKSLTESYVPVYDSNRINPSFLEIEGEWIPINAKEMGDQVYSVTLPDNFDLAEDMTVVRMFGITFGKMITEVEPLKTDRGSCEFLGAV
jgi:hypothetical protein